MPDYQIDIAVEPDGSRFPERLAAVVGKAEARQDPLEVPLEPKVGREFSREAQRKTKAALAALDAELELTPKLPKNFRREVEGLARKALAGEGVELPVAPTLSKGFRRDLQRSIREATAGEAVEIPVQASLGRGFRTGLQRKVREELAERPIEAQVVGKLAPGFRGKLQRTVTEALKAKPIDAPVNLSVSRRGMADFTGDVLRQVAQVTALASSTGAADVNLGVDATKFQAELVGEVTAATRGLNLTDAGAVTITADTGPAVTEIAAVGAAGREASGGVGVFTKGLGLAALGVGGLAVAAGGAGLALYSIGSSFDDAYDTIATTTGAAGAQLAGLEQSFRNVAATVPSEFADVSDAVAGVYQRLGLTGPVAEEVAGQLLNLSRITGTDLTANLEGSAAALQSFSIPAEKMPGALDAIFRASQASGVGVDSLTSSLSSSGAALRTAGFSFEESTALLAQLQRAGVPAESVIGSLGIAARKLAKDGKDPAKAIGDLTTKIAEAKDPTEALALAQEVFGRGAVGITDAIRSGKFEMSDFLAVVQGGRSTIAETSADTADAAESFQLLKNNLKLALESPAASFFGEISGVVKGLVPELAKLAPSIAQLVGGFGSVASGLLAGVLPIIQELVPALAPIGKVLGGAFEEIGKAAAPLAGSIGRFLAALAPLLPVVAKIAGELLTAFAPALDALAAPEFVDALVSLAESFGEILLTVAPLLPLLVRLAVPVVTLLAKFLAFEPVLDGLVAGFVAYKVATTVATAATKLFALAGQGLALNPVGLAVAAVVALGVAVFVAYKKIKPFRELVDSVGRYLRDKLWPAIVNVGKAVARWLVDTFGKARDVFERVWPIAKTLFGIFARIQFGPVLKLAQALGKLFTGDFSGFVAKLKEAVLVVPQAIADLARLIGPALGKVGEWIVTEGVPLLARYYLKAWEAIFRFVLDAYPKAVGFLLELVGKIGSWLLTTAVPAIAGKAAELTGAFLGWLTRAIVTLPLKLAEFGLNLLAWIIGVPIWLAYEAGKIGLAFIGWLDETLRTLPGKLFRVGVAILSWIAAVAPQVASKALELAGSFLGWVGRVLSELPGKLASITTSVLEWLAGLPARIIEKVPAIVEAAKGIGSAILEGIGKGIKNAVSFVGDVAGAIWRAVKDFVNDNVIDPIREFSVRIDPPGPGVLYDGKPFGSFPRLAEGGLVTAPTMALIGEAGPELVLPLTDRARLLELLTQAGLLTTSGQLATSGALAAAGGLPAPTLPAGAADAGASAGAAVGGLPPAGLTWQNDLESLKTWAADSVKILTDLGAQVTDGSLPPLTAWRDAVAAIFTDLQAGVDAWAAATLVTAGAWAAYRLPAATLPALGTWRSAVLAVVTAAAAESGRAFDAGLSTMAVLAAAGGIRVVAAMESALSGGTAKVETVVGSYARKLGEGLNPVLRAVGKQPLRFAEGGPVPGPDVRRDVVPALLMPGEVVIRRASVESFGLGNLLALNAGQVPDGWVVPKRYAEGGQVTGDTQGLNPVFHQRLGLWSAAVGQAYNVGSGYRSMQEQARLYQAYLAGTGNLAAPPGSSMHNFGLASDGPHWKNRNPGAFGLRFPIPSEDWHVEPVEARAWARSGDGAAGGAGALAGLAPLPQVPGMPFDGAVADVATAVLTYAYQAALAWAGAQVMPGGAPTLTASSFPPNVQRILATIRALESGGNYSADNPNSSAFGAYQFLASTYAGLARRFGYSATDLSASTQDAIAGRYVQEILSRYHGDLRAVPATWYVGSYNPANLNYVPGGGNTLTVADYVSRWLAKYGSIEGFADGGLVTADGLYHLAERNRPELVMPLTKPDRMRQLAEEHALDQLLYGDRGTSGRSGPTIEGDVILQVTPPGAADPENYGMALSHRIVPVLAAAFSR